MISDLLRLARRQIRDLKPYSSARSLVTSGSCFLDANENPFAPYPGGISEQGLNRYPEPQPKALRERLAQLYETSPDHLLIGRGADEAIDTLVRTFCEAGKDSILICPPTYGMYEVSAHIQGAAVASVPLTSDFQADIQKVREALCAETSTIKLAFFCTPNNPTGNLLDRSALFTLAKDVGARALIVVDEAYLEFSGQKSLASEIDHHPNIVVLRTLSKAWGLAGARCGVAIAQPDLVGLLQKVRAPYPMSLPSVQAIERAISGDGKAIVKNRVEQIVKERDRLAVRVAQVKTAEKVFKSDANFILIKCTDSLGWTRLCKAAGIIVRDRNSDFALANCLRVTVGTRAENEAFLAVIEKHFGIKEAE